MLRLWTHRDASVQIIVIINKLLYIVDLYFNKYDTNIYIFWIACSLKMAKWNPFSVSTLSLEHLLFLPI